MHQFIARFRHETNDQQADREEIFNGANWTDATIKASELVRPDEKLVAVELEDEADDLPADDAPAVGGFILDQSKFGDKF